MGRYVSSAGERARSLRYAVGSGHSPMELSMSAPVIAPTILIVDDTEVNVLLLQSVLDAEGFRTLTAADGAAARELARVRNPDLILLDVVMRSEEHTSELQSL